MNSPIDFAILSLLSPIYDEAGAHAGYLKIIRDVSERQKAKQDVLAALQTDDLTGLTNLPVNQIKLDISFTRCLPQDGHVKKIVGAIINLAHALDLQVVAEGVERREQLLVMSRMKCDALQGYYFSRPMVAQRMTRWMKECSTNGF